MALRLAPGKSMLPTNGDLLLLDGRLAATSMVVGPPFEGGVLWHGRRVFFGEKNSEHLLSADGLQTHSHDIDPATETGRFVLRDGSLAASYNLGGTDGIDNEAAVVFDPREGGETAVIELQGYSNAVGVCDDELYRLVDAEGTEQGSGIPDDRRGEWFSQMLRKTSLIGAGDLSTEPGSTSGTTAPGAREHVLSQRLYTTTEPGLSGPLLCSGETVATITGYSPSGTYDPTRSALLLSAWHRETGEQREVPIRLREGELKSPQEDLPGIPTATIVKDRYLWIGHFTPGRVEVFSTDLRTGETERLYALHTREEDIQTVSIVGDKLFVVDAISDEKRDRKHFAIDWYDLLSGERHQLGIALDGDAGASLDKVADSLGVDAEWAATLR